MVNNWNNNIYIYIIHIPYESKHLLLEGTANPPNHGPQSLFLKKVRLDP